jgi:hypothetical protein
MTTTTRQRHGPWLSLTLTATAIRTRTQRDWAGLGARRQLNEPMDLDPGAQEQHAEPRRAAAAAEPHKRRALPAGADRAAIALAENVPVEEIPAGAKLASMALGDGRPLEGLM